MMTLDDVSAQPALLQLAKEHSENKSGQGIVFFAGSGLSQPAGLPTWAELRRILTKEANAIVSINAISEVKLRPLFEKLKTTDNHWEAFSLIKEIMGRTSFSNRIREIFYTDENVDPPNIYKMICELNIRGIISLNIDGLLMRALSQVSPDPVNPVYGKNVNDKLDILLRERPYVYQPHGHVVSESSWIFTKKDLDNLLDSNLHDEFLSATFLFNTVVFIGISADDIGASHRLLNLRERNLTTHSHYWIATDSHVEKREWAEENGIQQILYPSTLGHEICLNRIINTIKEYKSFDKVDKNPVIGKAQPKQSTSLSADELYKLPNIDDIRLQLNNLIGSHMDEHGEIEYSDYKIFCQKYARSIHSAYMMPSGVSGDESWFGYKITGEALGGRTIGRVFPGIDSDGSPIAIKILDQRRYSDELYLSAFRRGIKSLKILEKSRLSGIVKVRDAYEVPPTIIMDYESCSSLRDVVEAKKVDQFESLKIVERAADIILNAHMLPEIVLHRDIKPSNVLLVDFDWSDSTYGDIKVIDFDLSWYKGAVGEDFVRTDRESMGFQAPEQVEGPGSANRRTTFVDSYGLGATLYFCVSGEAPPIKAAREADWEEKVKRICERRFAEHVEISHFMSRLIGQSMADISNDRISVSEIKSRLRDAIQWIESDKQSCSIRFVIEMICSISSSGDYRAGARQQSFHFDRAHGISVTGRYDYLEDVVVFDFEYRKPKNVHNSRADAVLNRLKYGFNDYYSGIPCEKVNFKFTGTREFDARVIVSPKVAQTYSTRIAQAVREVVQVLSLS